MRYLPLLLSCCFCLVLPACHRESPLPTDLAAVKCWEPEDNFYARVPFGQAKVTYLCAPKQRAANPELLKCDPDSRPLICEDKGVIMLSRTPKGHVYAVNGGLADKLDKREVSETSDATGYASELALSFSVTDDWHELKMYEEYFEFDEAKEYLPILFDVKEGVLCHRYASWLGAGRCEFIAKTPSLHWRISIGIYKDNNEKVTESEYRREFIFWRKYLKQMLADPA